MKTLKFESRLVKAILDKEKTTTWRLFDDKDLEEGDGILLIEKETGKEFAKAKIVKIEEKQIKEINESDCKGHEKFENTEKILKNLSKYYENITEEDTIKIIHFILEYKIKEILFQAI